MEVLPFSASTLAQALSNSYTPKDVIKNKNQYKYFLSYLGKDGLNAQYIIIESDYISKDYLNDYASYYAFCHKPYPKFCTRLHFWAQKIDKGDLERFVSGDDEVLDHKNYLGFIVVKHIPVTVIGYSILRTYPGNQDFDNRYFWGTREYKIHFLGEEFILNSLAFQEQDSVLAACATTAIWSMLNKASTDYHTVLKSPSEITKDADIISPDGSRLFPNAGLNLLQICKAIYNSGLVSEVKQPDFDIINAEGLLLGKVVSATYLKKVLNAYSPIGIPIILVIRVPNGGAHGLHAVTVSGYKKAAPKFIVPSDEISWLSDNIEKFYAHDDQWGPFVRLEFLSEFEINTPWNTLQDNQNATYVTNIVVPLYPKIRISYEDIEAIVLGLDRILSFFFQNSTIADLVWDVKIELSETFKKRVKNSTISIEEKANILFKGLPKYIWVATCYISEFKIFEFTFDATDVKHGMIGENIICYLEDSHKSILNQFLISNRHILQNLFQNRVSETYYQFLVDNIK